MIGWQIHEDFLCCKTRVAGILVDVGDGGEMTGASSDGLSEEGMGVVWIQCVKRSQIFDMAMICSW